MSNTDQNSADFLVELGVEELPPKSLSDLSQAFHDSIATQLQALNLSFQSVHAYASPRRLAVHVTDLQSAQPDQDVQTLGPAVKAAFDADGNPTPAAMGFAKKQGLEVSELSHIDTDKGPRLGYSKVEKGRRAIECLESIVTRALEQLPVAKRMRWGSGRAEFVRPAHWLLMLYGNSVVEATILGLKASNTTRGHRFHANKDIPIRHPNEYLDVLEQQGSVIADFQRRKDDIRKQVEACARNLGKGNATAVIEEGLLQEVTALVEWPVALAGKFDEEFLKVPREALVSSMAEHQKYFHVLDENGDLLPAFITVANLKSTEPEKIVDGNERVIRPRLADAAFFYEKDLATPFKTYRDRLKPVLFQKQLGTVFEKTERIAHLTTEIAPIIDADIDLARRAGELCKSDLVTEMVLEFPALQGVMGRYYAQQSDEDPLVCDAMQNHYLPKYANDALPANPVSTAVALADRLDTLTGIFGIKQTPTGSKDPFGLRRAALAILRILVDGQHSLSLRDLLDLAHQQHHALPVNQTDNVDTLMTFILSRFSAWFSSLNVASESYMAVQALSLNNPLDIYRRTLAVDEFAKNSPAAPALAAANKRVSNILSKDHGKLPPVATDTFVSTAETELFTALNAIEGSVRPSIEAHNYQAALAELAHLRGPVDTFFDQVMVMDENLQLRNNRLALLTQLRTLFLSIADISLLPTEKDG